MTGRHWVRCRTDSGNLLLKRGCLDGHVDEAVGIGAYNEVVRSLMKTALIQLKMRGRVSWTGTSSEDQEVSARV